AGEPVSPDPAGGGPARGARRRDPLPGATGADADAARARPGGALPHRPRTAAGAHHSPDAARGQRDAGRGLPASDREAGGDRRRPGLHRVAARLLGGPDRSRERHRRRALRERPAGAGRAAAARRRSAGRVTTMLSRREILVSGATAMAGVAIAARAQESAPEPSAPPAPATAVTAPNGSTLPWKPLNGAKVGHLLAEPFTHEFAPGLRARCWGYNGATPGPLIEAVEGDRVRIYVTNRLPEATAVHWHGLFVPNGMDGVAGLTQPGIPPGETFRYEFTLRQSGTFMYHP